MWRVNNEALTMTEGDYGVALTVSIAGVTLTNYDSVRLTIKNKIDGDTVVTKEYSAFTNNAFNFSLTAVESALLTTGNYVYSLDWYQSGSFMCNIIEHALFKVVDKA